MIKFFDALKNDSVFKTLKETKSIIDQTLKSGIKNEKVIENQIVTLLNLDVTAHDINNLKFSKTIKAMLKEYKDSNNIIDLTNTLISKWRTITKADSDKKKNTTSKTNTKQEHVKINFEYMEINQGNIEKFASYFQSMDYPAKRKSVIKSIFEWISKFDLISCYHSNLVNVYEMATGIEKNLYQKYSNEEPKYLKQAHTIVTNLAKNKEFVQSLLEKKISYEDLAGMSAQDMLSQEEKSRRAKIKEDAFNSRRSDWNRIQSVNNIGMYRCGKCKGYNTFYYQAQIRRADEPMTTFVTCNNCNHQWKC